MHDAPHGLRHRARHTVPAALLLVTKWHGLGVPQDLESRNKGTDAIHRGQDGETTAVERRPSQFLDVWEPLSSR